MAVPPNRDCARLAAVLEDLRARAGLKPVGAASLAEVPLQKLVRWEKGEARPSLRSLAALADVYRVPFLDLLNRAVGSTATSRQPLGGSHAEAVTAVLLLWEASGVEPTRALPWATTYRRKLGRMLQDLRHYEGWTSLQGPPVARSILGNAEGGYQRPWWPHLVALGTAYKVGVLVLLVHAAAAAPDPTAASLVACGDRCIPSPDAPNTPGFVALPDAPTIVANVAAWAELVGTSTPR